MREKDTQTTREPVRARESPDVPAPVRPARVAAVLAMQRTAGNRATGEAARRLLARSEPPAKKPIDPPGTGYDGINGSEHIGRALDPQQVHMATMFRQWLEANRGAKDQWSASAASIASKHKGSGPERAALYAELQRQIIQVDRNWYAGLVRGVDDEWIFLSKTQLARTFVVRPDGTCWAGSQKVLTEVGDRRRVDYEDESLFPLHEVEKLPPRVQAEKDAYGLNRQAARGAAGGWAIIGALNGILDYFRGKAEVIEQAAIERELEAHSAGIGAHQAEKPHDGALVRITTRRTKLPDAPTDGPEKLVSIEVGYGRTESEALADLDRQARAAPAPAANEVFSRHTRWVEPARASAAAELRPPFPRVASGGIRGTTLILQNVKWDADGFDDEDQAQVAFAAEQDVRFSVLRVPPKLAGQTVPLEERAPREGPKVPSVDLDPGTPFADVHAVAVFPENEVTRQGFERAPATVLGTSVGGFANFELVRWIRPENLRVFDGR